MHTSTIDLRLPAATVSGRQLVQFGVAAITSGWILLSIPLIFELPLEPFVLATLIFGLVIPALVLRSRVRRGSAWALLRSVIRLPRPVSALVPAALGIPVVVWSVAWVLDVEASLTPALILALAGEMLLSLVIVNLWEEMAWTGFFQGPLSERRGVVVGGVTSAALFGAVHLPLAVLASRTWGEVALQVLVLAASGIGLRLAVGVLYAGAGRSILAVALLHASFNSSGGLVTPGNDAVRIMSVAAIGVIAVVAYRSVRTPRPQRPRGAAKSEILRYAAFTDHGAGGNPAGVVLNAQGMTESQMISIAADLGYSESAFVSPTDGTTLGLRFFSPRAEVDFCGHATIATAVAIADRDGRSAVRFATAAGEIDVQVMRRGEELHASLTSAPASSRPATDEELDRTLAAFGWTREVLDPRFPAHVGFAGNHHMIFAARFRSTLADFDYEFDELAETMAEFGWTTVHVFRESGPDRFDVRNAFPPGGVREDPATGAAAAAFGGYLRAIGSPLRGETLLRQGVEMGSPSRLVISPVAGSDSIRVSGTASAVSESLPSGTVVP